MPSKRNSATSKGPPGPPIGLVKGDKIIVTGAGRDWSAQVTTRLLASGIESIHPQYDDTAVFVTFDETGISMPVSRSQITKVRR